MKNSQKTTALDSFVDPNAPICYGILMPGDHCPDGVPVIKVRNIVGGRVLESDLLKTSIEIHRQYKRAEVKEGDLLLTIRGTTGRVAIVPKSLTGANITQDTARIRVSTGDDFLYLYYALQSHVVQQQIDLNTVGQAVKGINIGEVRKLKIFHPPIAEQKEISKILSTWDSAITAAEQLLANSQQQKKALMQQLLTGEKRFARFNGKWEKTKIGVIAKISKGKALSSSGLVEGIYPVFAGGKSSPYNHNEYTHENVITVSASGAYAGYVAFHQRKIWASDCSVVEAKKGNSIKYIYQYLLFQQNKIYALQSGGAQPHIYPKDLETIKIKVPLLDEQEKIVSVMEAADQEILKLQQKIAFIKKEKKALMQQLLTGKRRVSV